MYQLPSVDILCSASLKERLVGVDVNWIGSLDPSFLKENFPNPKSFEKKKTPKKTFLDLSNQKTKLPPNPSKES